MRVPISSFFHFRRLRNYATCTVQFYAHLLEHTKANKEEDKQAAFDDSGEDSLAELKSVQDRPINNSYKKMTECHDPDPFLCKIMNLIGLVPQKYLEHFALMLRIELVCMSESLKDRMNVQNESFKLVCRANNT